MIKYRIQYPQESAPDVGLKNCTMFVANVLTQGMAELTK